MTNDCEFCSGNVIEATGIGNGIQSVGMVIESLRTAIFGSHKKPDHCMNGIQLQEGNRLCFDNSSCEYALLSVEIKHCPFCGRALESEPDE